MNGIAKNSSNDERKNIAIDVFARIWALWGLVIGYKLIADIR